MKALPLVLLAIMASACLFTGLALDLSGMAIPACFAFLVLGIAMAKADA